MKPTVYRVLVTALLLCAGICSSRQAGDPLAKWQMHMLEKIKLQAYDAGLPEAQISKIMTYDENLCYTKDCLETALEIMSATNFTVNPCQPDNWRKFACERRLSFENLNSFEVLTKLAETQTLHLLEDNTGAHDNDFLFKEAQTFYYQCKNKAQNDEQDVKDIYQALVDLYGEWPIFSDKEPSPNFDWLKMVAGQNRFERAGYQPLLLQTKIPQDAVEIELHVGKLVLPEFLDIRSVLKIVSKYAKLDKPAKLEWITKMFQFWQGLANVVAAVDNPVVNMTIAELNRLTNETVTRRPINWLAFFKLVYRGSDMEITEETRIRLEVETIMAILKFVENAETQRTLADALFYHLTTVLIQETTGLLDDLNSFKCTEEQGARDWICLKRVEEIFGYSIGKTYLKVYYKDESVTPVIKAMMDKIKKGYNYVLDYTKDLTNETRKMLKNRVAKMQTHYGMSNKMREDPLYLQKFYSGFEASQDKYSSYPLNYLKITSWATMKKASWNRMWAIMNSRGDYTNLTLYEVETWNHNLGAVNADYHRLTNTARIEGGIVQPPMFGVDRPGFYNYARLGMVLAHEIGHSYDTEGVKVDDNGKYSEDDWWDPVSRQKYDKWVDDISEDFGKEYHQVLGGTKEQVLTNPYKSVNEDIADIYGTYISFKAYSEYLKELEGQGKKETVLPGLGSLSPHKLFYMTYTNTWCDKKEIQDQYEDLFQTHSTGNTRATVPLKRSRQFAQTFGCPVPENAF